MGSVVVQELRIPFCFTMGRPKKIGLVHPVTKVTIYNDGTCSAGVGYNRNGYKIYSVVVKSKRRVVNKSYLLHRHVAELFIPNPEGKPIVNHKDGKKYNARASNLEWVTHSENTKHAYKIGLCGRKLTPKMVREIRRSTLPAYRIKYKYDVSEATIISVRRRLTWKHID